MKPLYHFLAYALLFSLGFLPVKADAPSDEQQLVQQIPASAWENHPEGISVALEYISKYEYSSRGAIALFIRNTSSTNKEFIRNDFSAMNGHTINVYYIDDKGVETILNALNIPKPTIPPGTPPEEARHIEELAKLSLSWGSRQSPPDPIKIEPAGTIVQYEPLASDEVAQVTKHFIKCIIHMRDPVTKKDFFITATPKLMTEEKPSPTPTATTPHPGT